MVPQSSCSGLLFGGEGGEAGRTGCVGQGVDVAAEAGGSRKVPSGAEAVEAAAAGVASGVGSLVAAAGVASGVGWLRGGALSVIPQLPFSESPRS
jgi:hypothetical protein